MIFLSMCFRFMPIREEFGDGFADSVSNGLLNPLGRTSTMDDVVDGNTPHAERSGNGSLGNASFQEFDFY